MPGVRKLVEEQIVEEIKDVNKLKKLEQKLKKKLPAILFRQ